MTGSADFLPIGRKHTVLICDDDRLVLATVAAGLRTAGFEVIEVDNGDDAILLARQHRPALALLDMRMHGKSGLDVAAYLRDYVGTPFMFLSAFGDEDIVRQAKAFGALEYLIKPVDVRKIVPAVESALARAAQAQAGAAAEVAGESLQRALADAEAIRARGESDTAIAIGILMERFLLGRAGARERLAHIARQTGVPLDAAAADIVERFDLINSVARLDARVPKE